VPAENEFRTNGYIGLEELQHVLVAGLSGGVVLANPACRPDAACRDQIPTWSLRDAVAVRDFSFEQ
jgi:hypothetical protein